MTTYHNLKELEGHVLEQNDRVQFGIYNYIVDSSFLYVNHSLDTLSATNDTIFQKLSIDKYIFCNEHYGYTHDGGGWPESRIKDYAALTRVVNALYQEIEKLPKQYFCPVEKVNSEVFQHIMSIYGNVIPTLPKSGYIVYSKDRLFCSNDKQNFPFAIEYDPKFVISPDITGKSITLKSTTHESKFQRKKARVERGTRPEGSSVCGRRSKASVAVGHLSYRKVIGC